MNDFKIDPDKATIQPKKNDNFKIPLMFLREGVKNDTVISNKRILNKEKKANFCVNEITVKLPFLTNRSKVNLSVNRIAILKWTKWT